ncbi:MAG: hypothetical protein BWX84_01853 [Verrucomicrobia bacterium ADurb.Bin118]|jgi:hypothetical protein|nr:MAG: hypothetical protein BWX84_01853 [Verrucomicrobia bacterium ADurb.Bin118]
MGLSPLFQGFSQGLLVGRGEFGPTAQRSPLPGLGLGRLALPFPAQGADAADATLPGRFHLRHASREQGHALTSPCFHAVKPPFGFVVYATNNVTYLCENQ